MTLAPHDDGFGQAVRLASDRMSREGADCPSPDELAAFADGTLLGDAHSAVVRHLSGCARCQDVVSAVARMSALTDVREAPARRPGGELVAFPTPPGRRMWRWVAPVAAATAAVLAWVVVSPVEPRRSPVAAEDPPMARNESPSVGPAPEGMAGVAGPEAAAPSPESLEASGSPTRARSLSNARDAPGGGRQMLAESAGDRSMPAPTSTAEVGGAGSAPTAPAAPDERRLDSERPKLADASAKQRSEEVAPAAGAPPVSPAANRAVAPTLERSNRAGTQDAAALSSVPSASRRWRVAAGMFEESGDEGRSWRAFPLPAGARVTVAEPAAPDVWWVAGQAGLVLRIEGGRVVEAARPSTSDITALGSTSATGVIVATSDGSRYETRDEGRSWRLLPSRE